MGGSRRSPYGVAFDDSGLTQSSMGAEVADYDNDGRLDLYVTSYAGEVATLYRNLGQGVFHDVTRITEAGRPTLRFVTWGIGFVDFDNDGDRDLYVACGHTDDTITLRDTTAAYAARNLVLQNLLVETGRARFVNVSDAAGDGLAVEKVSRGAAFDDLDGDGDIDGVVQNCRDRPTVLRNLLGESGSARRWIQVQLLGTRSPRDGVGARVTVWADNLRQVDEVHSGRGYQSHFGQRLHFGLGRRQRIDRLEVRWPSGTLQRLENVATNQVLRLVEPASGPKAKSESAESPRGAITRPGEALIMESRPARPAPEPSGRPADFRGSIAPESKRRGRAALSR